MNELTLVYCWRLKERSNLKIGRVESSRFLFSILPRRGKLYVSLGLLAKAGIKLPPAVLFGSLPRFLYDCLAEPFYEVFVKGPLE